MTDGRLKIEEGPKEVGLDVQDFGPGGGRSPDLWNFLQSGCAGDIFFGSETWVMTPRIGWALGSFHHKVDRRLSGMQPHCEAEGSWAYPLLAADILVAVL